MHRATGRHHAPIAAYGTATAASTLLAAGLAAAFVPTLTGPIALVGLLLGAFSTFAHDSQGTLVDTAVALVLTAGVVLGAGAASTGLDPRSLGASLVVVASMGAWFASFVVVYLSR